MSRIIGFIFLSLLFATCTTVEKQDQLPLTGTWELIAASSIEKDSTFSTFDPNRNMIKIINSTHFAFLNHAIHKDSVDAPYYAGGGRYTLQDSIYTEHLDYFNDKAWEGHTFEFVVKIKNDTLIQQGVERIEDLGIDRVIIETYKRIKQ